MKNYSENRINEKLEELKNAMFEQNWNALAQSWSAGKYYIHSAASELKSEAGLAALEELTLRALKQDVRRCDSRAKRLLAALKSNNTLAAAALLASTFRSAAKNWALNECASLRLGCATLQASFAQGGEEEEEEHPFAAAVAAGAPFGAIQARNGAQIVLCGVEFQAQKTKKPNKKVVPKHASTRAYAALALF